MERAYVLLNVEIDTGKEVLNALEEIPDVKEAHQIYGVYDIIIRVEAARAQIRSTLSLLCIKRE